MTKKDYVAIAGAIQDVVNFPHVRESKTGLAVISMTAKRIAEVCEEDNGRFDKDRFLRACGVE